MADKIYPCVLALQQDKDEVQMKDQSKKTVKPAIPKIPKPDSSRSSQMIKQIGKASDLNSRDIASALRKWLTEEK